MSFDGTGAGESKRSKSSSFEDLAKRVQVPVQIAAFPFRMPFSIRSRNGHWFFAVEDFADGGCVFGGEG